MSQARLTNAHRLEICQHKAKNPKMRTSSKFGAHLTQSAISLILKKRSDLESMTDTELSAKRPRVAQNPKLEEDLSTWTVQCQTRNVALTGEVIEVKVNVFY